MKDGRNARLSMAGLLAHGLALRPPSRPKSVASRASFAAYSCGGSQGIGDAAPHPVPFSSARQRRRNHRRQPYSAARAKDSIGAQSPRAQAFDHIRQRPEQAPCPSWRMPGAAAESVPAVSLAERRLSRKRRSARKCGKRHTAGHRCNFLLQSKRSISVLASALATRACRPIIQSRERI